ncbi:hypothetical protein [Dermatobacter hominis]|uniref:hypothetical protein n=1 Tax=Dermatobacter hominis TaxID=2884263 RepID=UPI001D12D050|nr:hypothetical protein [Dermatobacter hominis]UDY35554.1 hypothetical protein LH044_19760 [Dermatobacter hominis]
MLRRRAIVLFAAFVAASLALAGCLPGAGRTFNGPDPVRGIPFKGLGAWWDVWDWSPTFTNGSPALGLTSVDRLANSGVQTLYIQTASYRNPANVLDEALLRRIVNRAHSRGMKVVGWYLPQFLDTKTDIARLSAMVGVGVDGIGIDIESTDNPNVADRTDKLLAEVRFLRLLHPDVPMAAIPVTPVIWEELNRSWWPNFPYRELAKYVDAWMPMAYWSYRRAGSFPEWGDPYRYTYESVVRLRILTGRPNLPVHPIGGEGAGMTPNDAALMARAVADSRSIGGSVYDDRTTPPDVYPVLGYLRRAQVK